MLPCGPAEGELQALRAAAGLADLSALGRLSVAGPDRREFLNGLLTSDVKSLAAGKGLPSLVLTPKGLLAGDFVLYDRGEDLLAVGEPGAIEGLRRTLLKSIVLTESRLEDAGGSGPAFALAGPAAPAVLAAAGAQAPGLLPFGCARLSGTWEGSWLLSYPSPAAGTFVLLVPPDKAEGLWRALLKSGAPRGLKPAGREAWEAFRIESGVPRWGADLDEGTLPLEAGLEGAISFTKGCYLGQETTSRTKNVGHVNRRLVRLALSGQAEAGSVLLFEGPERKEAGRLTSVERVGAKPAALGMVRLEAARPGTVLAVTGGVAARVLALA